LVAASARLCEGTR
jgi:hypothetical protein